MSSDWRPYTHTLYLYLCIVQESANVNGEGSREGGGEGEVVHTLLGGATAGGAGSGAGLGGVVNPELARETEEALIEKTLLSIQEKVCHIHVYMSP